MREVDLSLGFSKCSYQVIVDGLVVLISACCESLECGHFYADMNITDADIKRSLYAYLQETSSI
jgi:neutral ceramidase